MNIYSIDKKLETIDYILLILLPIVSSIVSIIFNLPYLISILFFYGLPGIYLTIRYGKIWQFKKSFFFVIIICIPLAIVIDYIGIESGVWYTPNTLFSGRFLGVIPWEDFIWMITGTWVIIIIYEIFFDKGKHELIDQRILYFVSIAIMLLSAFSFFHISGNLFIFTFESKYTYLILGSSFFLIPTIIFLLRFPKFFRKSLLLAGYFFYLTFIFEITAVYLQQWIFTGSYVFPPFNILGYAIIPFEELFFIGVVGPFAAIAFYEFFDDDEK